MGIWSEIRSNYFEEETGCVYIDAWETDNDNEEGTVIAKVNVFTKEIEYFDPVAKTDAYAQEIIGEVLKEYESYGYLNNENYKVKDEEWDFQSVSDKVEALKEELSTTNKSVPSYQIQEILSSLLLNRDTSSGSRVPSWFNQLDVPKQFQPFLDEIFIDFGSECEENFVFNWEEATNGKEYEVER